eukprot:TRINITY_DN24384_c2_g1_i2.p2 TRINITY_DN24384_c2_g1~~TRINITY_DN24384_c2_g1_i2.p2  ORF type:complete len:618 (+),score=160.32 TRINITY_DN24384_c2_g1_i2:75-1856(+)
MPPQPPPEAPQAPQQQQQPAGAAKQQPPAGAPHRALDPLEATFLQANLKPIYVGRVEKVWHHGAHQRVLVICPGSAFVCASDAKVHRFISAQEAAALHLQPMPKAQGWQALFRCTPAAQEHDILVRLKGPDARGEADRIAAAARQAFGDVLEVVRTEEPEDLRKHAVLRRSRTWQTPKSKLARWSGPAPAPVASPPGSPQATPRRCQQGSLSPRAAVTEDGAAWGRSAAKPEPPRPPPAPSGIVGARLRSAAIGAVLLWLLFPWDLLADPAPPPQPWGDWLLGWLPSAAAAGRVGTAALALAAALAAAAVGLPALLQRLRSAPRPAAAAPPPQAPPPPPAPAECGGCGAADGKGPPLAPERPETPVCRDPVPEAVDEPAPWSAPEAAPAAAAQQGDAPRGAWAAPALAPAPALGASEGGALASEPGSSPPASPPPPPDPDWLLHDAASAAARWRGPIPAPPAPGAAGRLSVRDCEEGSPSPRPPPPAPAWGPPPPPPPLPCVGVPLVSRGGGALQAYTRGYLFRSDLADQQSGASWRSVGPGAPPAQSVRVLGGLGGAETALLGAHSLPPCAALTLRRPDPAPRRAGTASAPR